MPIRLAKPEEYLSKHGGTREEKAPGDIRLAPLGEFRSGYSEKENFTAHDWSPAVMSSWEGKFLLKHPVGHAALKASLNVLPLIKYFTLESAREEGRQLSGAGIATEIGLEALAFVPFGLVGKGLKVFSPVVPSFIKVGAKRLAPSNPFKLQNAIIESHPWADKLLKDFRFEPKPATQRLVEKYGVRPEEAHTIMQGKDEVYRWSSFNMPSRAMNKLFTKTGDLSSEVWKNVKKWSAPLSEQERRHALGQWNRLSRELLSGTGIKQKELFASQAKRVFGAEKAADLSFKDISLKEMGNILLDVMRHKGKLLRPLDISPSGLAYATPSRKVFGNHGYYSFYEFAKQTYGNGNRYMQNKVYQFFAIMSKKAIAGNRMLTELKAKELGKLKMTKNFTKQEWDEAGRLVGKIDDMQGLGKNPEEIQAHFRQQPWTVQQLAKSYYEWTDHMYADHVKMKIPSLFEKAGLTADGEQGLQAMMKGPKGLERWTDEILSVGNNLSYQGKLMELRKLLASAKSKIQANPQWFSPKPLASLSEVEKQSLASKVGELITELTFKERGQTKGFVNYLENYATRVFEEGVTHAESRIRSLAKNTYGRLAKFRSAGYTKMRQRETALDPTFDLDKIIIARIRMQAKELIVYPELPKLVDTARAMPYGLRNYTEHYLARMLGEPSSTDAAVAAIMTRTFGKKIFTADQIRNISYLQNDLIYMGGIGFKPFSAMRNYFQTLMNVPADLGGLKDFYWLAVGHYKATMEADTRYFIRRIGAIQDWAPDIYFKPEISGFGNTLQKVRDTSLWMFKATDEANRYITGGAALAKWDFHFNRALRADGSLNTELFLKKLNVNSRESWIREPITDLVKSGRRAEIETAKEKWVKDVIDDTQYLYGTMDSPLISYTGGVVSKSAFVFQSWWMNYGSLLAKWMTRTPSTESAIPATTQRMFTWMLSSAIAYTAMKEMWGHSTARRTVFLGPFPTDFWWPASYDPFIKGFQAAVSAGQLGIPLLAKSYHPEDVKEVTSKMRALVRSSSIYVPGGLQIYQSYRGASKEGFKGLMKSIIRYRPPKEESEERGGL